MQRCHMELSACKQSLQCVLGHIGTSRVLTPAHARTIVHNQEVSSCSAAVLTRCSRLPHMQY